MIPIIMIFMYPLVMIAVELMRLGIYVAIVVIMFLIRATIDLTAEAFILFRRWRHGRRMRALSRPGSWRSEPGTLRHTLMWRYGGIVWKLRAPIRWWQTALRTWRRGALSGNAAHVSAQRRSGQ